MYNKFNPIHFIKGKKTVINEELIKKYSNSQEQKKRAIMAILMYIIPFLYIYISLIISSNISFFKTLNHFILYIPALLIFSYIKFLRIKYEQYLIYICSQREKTNSNIEKQK